MNPNSNAPSIIPPPDQPHQTLGASQRSTDQSKPHNPYEDSARGLLGRRKYISSEVGTEEEGRSKGEIRDKEEIEGAKEMAEEVGGVIEDFAVGKGHNKETKKEGRSEGEGCGGKEGCDERDDGGKGDHGKEGGCSEKDGKTNSSMQTGEGQRDELANPKEPFKI